MKNKPEPDSDLILYLTEDGRTRLQVRLEGETVWLSLNQMVDLFQRDKSVISRHIKNLFTEGELSAESTVAKSATVQTEGGKQVTREIEFYNLDVIISVGYRVKSKRGTQFRIWATQRLREYIVKGFTMDDERLKNPPGKGHIDYFDELLERIRDIRSSERRVYLRVREILALAADYEPTEPETQVFFQTMQNKLQFAATGNTAAELGFGKGEEFRIPVLGRLSLPQVLANHGYLSCHRSIPSNFLNPISIGRGALDRGGGGRQKRRRASGCRGCRCGFDFPLHTDASAECGCGSDGDYGEWGGEFFHGDVVCCLIIVPAI